MKKKILLFSLLLSGILVKAQDTTTCSITVVDTVRYVNSISSGVQGTSINMSNGGGPGTSGYTGYAQLFEAPDTITLNGFCFYGVIEGALPDTVDAEIFLTDGPSGVPGTLVENVRVGVPNFTSYTGPMNDPSIRRCAMFSSPIEIEGDYFLSVRNVTDVNVFMAINFDGDAEATPTEFTYYHEDAGTSTAWYDLDIFGVGWGFNPILEPLVEYSFEGTAISTDSVLCTGDTISVEMIIAEGDSVLFNEFYNPNYSSYAGLIGSNIFNYGDGSSSTVDTFHVYNTGGNYTVDRNFSIITPIWSQNSVNFSCNTDVRVVEVGLDLGTDTTVCAGTLLTFDAGLDFDSYLWSDLSALSTMSLDTDGLTNGMYSYYVDVTKEFCSASDSVTVTIEDLLVNIGSDTSVCAGTIVTFDAGSGFDSYEWSDLTTGNSLTVDTDGMVIDNYSFYVDVTKGGCDGSDSVEVNVGQLFVDLGVDTTLCLNQDVTFTGGAYSSYSWSTGQTTETISVGPFTSTSVDSYILTVTQGDCVGSDTLILTVDNCLGVDEVLSTSINVYPNPSHGIFNIDLSELNSTTGYISVRDATGRVVWSKNISNSNEEIDLLSLAKGSYLIEINAGGNQIIKKIQIIK